MLIHNLDFLHGVLVHQVCLLTLIPEVQHLPCCHLFVELVEARLDFSIGSTSARQHTGAKLRQHCTNPGALGYRRQSLRQPGEHIRPRNAFGLQLRHHDRLELSQGLILRREVPFRQLRSIGQFRPGGQIKLSIEWCMSSAPVVDSLQLPIKGRWIEAAAKRRTTCSACLAHFPTGPVHHVLRSANACKHTGIGGEAFFINKRTNRRVRIGL